MSRDQLTFAMGCFWGPEDRFARIPGVTATQVGYSGGTAAHRSEDADDSEAVGRSEAAVRPNERERQANEPEDQSTALRSSGADEPPSADSAVREASVPETPVPTHRRLNGHSEAVEVEFDPAVVSLEELLRRFWSEHNPAAIEGYKPEDPRYRSLLFYRSEEQRAVMERIRREMAEQGRSSEATELKPLEAFYPAEERHQRYEEKKRRRGEGESKPDDR
ncbi:hypothetical protein B9G55_12770 [Saccharibacillus sp. O16]|nr:hypothetical protein B9G55_12770 [Saccharibacillus sp. O16]